MITMQALLEKDKERFLSRAAAAQSSAQAVSVMEEEVSRLLTLYNEEEESDQLKQTAMAMCETLLSSAGFLDCDGESVIWSKAKYREGINKPKRSIWFVIFLLAAIGLLVGGIGVLVYLGNILPLSDPMILGFGLIGASILCFFLAGLLSAKKKEENKEELYAETIPSADKTYHVLLNAVLRMDKVLEQVRNKELLQQRDALLDEKDGLKKEDIQLYSSLLESAYSQGDDEYAKEIVNDLKFYLHKRKIEVVDYNGENKEYFERMPGEAMATIRPALLFNKEVLRKGLATGV